MPKKTILQLVQKIGAAITSDEIDSLNETIESSDITDILSDTYSEVISRDDWEFLKDRVLQLDARPIASTQINTLVIPQEVSKITCLKYRSDNEVEEYKTLKYEKACDFVDRLHRRNPTDDDTTTIINEDNVSLFVHNNKSPFFWTSFDEETITFDGFDQLRGNGNIPQDSVIVADVIPVVDFSDPDATLPIPERMESLVLNEAISTASIRLRQTKDPKAEQIAKRNHNALHRLSPRTREDEDEVHYGRRSRSGR